MIELTKLKGGQFLLNPDRIQRVDAVPDTHIHLVCGDVLHVLESPHQIREKIIDYRAEVLRRANPGPAPRTVRQRQKRRCMRRGRLICAIPTPPENCE